MLLRFYYHIGMLVTGFLLDLLFGDPVWIPHSIRLIGRMIAYLEVTIRKKIKKSVKGELTGGRVLVALMVFFSIGISAGILHLFFLINHALYFICGSFLCYQMIAMKDLKKESMDVYQALQNQDLFAARKAVARIVGRDTEQLDEIGITKATIETVAENTSDGVIAPIFYMMLLGPVGGILYKTVNTMDSMIGYKNETYLYFGRAAAKLDDVANFIPSRIAAVLMIVASGLLHMSMKDAIRIFRRDRYRHPSPNAAQTESVVAGALQIQLLGDAYYFGKLHKKECVGDAIRTIGYQEIKRTNELLYMTGTIMIIIIMIVTYVIFLVF